MDIVYIVAIVLFLGLATALAVVCDKLKERP